MFLQIKEETDTRIEIPTENSTSDVIVITGEKDKAERAREKILAIQNELVSMGNFLIKSIHLLREI